jgi:SagB-type dehydrogenase family enzyme
MIPSIARARQGRKVALPEPCVSLGVDLAEALKARRSVRPSVGGRVTPAAVASLLAHAIGHHGFGFSDRAGVFRRRHFPSAAARTTAEFYFYFRTGSGFEPGLFFCEFDTRTLTEITPYRDDLAPKVGAAFGSATWIAEAPSLLFITSAVDRLEGVPDAARNSILEAGHAAQNVCLVAAALGLSVCPIRSWESQHLTPLLGLNAGAEVLSYALAIG